MKYFRHLFDWDTEASPPGWKSLSPNDVDYLGQGNQISILFVSRKALAMWDEVEFCFDFSSYTLAARFSSLSFILPRLLRQLEKEGFHFFQIISLKN